MHVAKKKIEKIRACNKNWNVLKTIFATNFHKWKKRIFFQYAPKFYNLTVHDVLTVVFNIDEIINKIVDEIINEFVDEIVDENIVEIFDENFVETVVENFVESIVKNIFKKSAKTSRDHENKVDGCTTVEKAVIPKLVGTVKILIKIFLILW